MDTRTNNITTGFTTETRFTPAPLSAVTPNRTTAEGDLEQLKNRLLRQELERVVTLEMTVQLRRAANDAAALVWLTPYPLLLLPVLFEEKVRMARRNAARAALIRQQSSELLALAE